ncbi:hypothetical protein [Microbacterium paulum]
MDAEQKRRRSLAWALLLVQFFVAFVATGLVWFRGISTPHCGQACDFDLLRDSAAGFSIYALALLLAGGVAIWLGSSRRWVVWLPATGLILTFIGALVADSLSRTALGLV